MSPANKFGTDYYTRLRARKRLKKQAYTHQDIRAHAVVPKAIEARTITAMRKEIVTLKRTVSLLRTHLRRR